MPLVAKEKARLDLRYLQPSAAASLTPALAATLATAAQGSKADTAYSWGNHAGLYASAAQGSLADIAYAWGPHAGLYVPQQTGTPVAVIVQLYTRNQKGGSATASVWNLRMLNTIVGDGTAGGVSVASGTVTLPNGTYWIRGWGLAYGVGAHCLRLRITSAGARTLAVGSSELATLTVQTKATVEAVAVISNTTLGYETLQLQHKVGTPATARDLGDPANLDDYGEVYSGLTLWRTA